MIDPMEATFVHGASHAYQRLLNTLHYTDRIMRVGGGDAQVGATLFKDRFAEAAGKVAAQI